MVRPEEERVDICVMTNAAIAEAIEIADNQEQGIMCSRDQDELRYPRTAENGCTLYVDETIMTAIDQLKVHYDTTTSQAARLLMRIGIEQSKKPQYVKLTIGKLTKEIAMRYDNEMAYYVEKEMKTSYCKKTEAIRFYLRLGAWQLYRNLPDKMKEMWDGAKPE